MNNSYNYLKRYMNLFIKKNIPFNEQYECKDFYLKNIPLKHIPIKNNNNNTIVIRKTNDKIIPYKDQYECRDF